MNKGITYQSFHHALESMVVAILNKDRYLVNDYNKAIQKSLQSHVKKYGLKNLEINIEVKR